MERLRMARGMAAQVGAPVPICDRCFPCSGKPVAVTSIRVCGRGMVRAVTNGRRRVQLRRNGERLCWRAAKFSAVFYPTDRYAATFATAPPQTEYV